MLALDLFTGYGGLTLALKDIVRPIAYVEVEEYAQKIIASRMADGSLPRAPILADVKNVQGFAGACDIIYGGFPCQDISVAGMGRGLAGERSGLFFEIVRLTKEIKPSFVFLENVPAIRTRGLREVIGAFTEVGYDCRWTCVSASSVGAPHKRERWFMLAYSNGIGLQGRIRTRRHKERLATTTDDCWWAVEPNVGRVAHGVEFRLDRLKALGNGVVPLQARTAFFKLLNKPF